MPTKDKVLQLRVDDELHQKIKQTAEADLRTQASQMSYLISLGLQERERLQRIREGRTQLDVDALEARR